MMKAGTYYVGDLCYVLNRNEWAEVCSQTIDKENMNCLEGEFVLRNGVRYAIYGTAYGDGYYSDQEDRCYDVDSGTLGCVEVSALKPECFWGIQGLGQIITFEKDFETSQKDGFISFGDVVIDTAQEPEEEHYEEGDFYEDEDEE